MKCRFFFCIVILFFSLNAFADNWPQWRGPDGNGLSRETGLPVRWTQSENIAWRFPLPGPAASTPIVWGNQIFLTSTENEDLVLISLNTSGKLLWKQTVATGNSSVKGDEGNFAAPSPSTDGKYVWAFFGTGDLVCFDFNGKEIWKTNLQQRYGIFNLYFVMASSPLLDKDRLYLQLIHGDASLVIALAKNSGKEIWKQNRITDARAECRHSYASPILYRDGKYEFLLVHGGDYITAHSLVNGAEIWRSGGFNPKNSYNPSLRFVSSPVAIPGLIVVPSAKNGPVLGLSPNIKGDITNSVEKRLWTLDQGTPDVPSPLIHGDLVYLNKENGDLICLDAKNGKVLYVEHTTRTRHRSSPVYADGKIYITSREGMVTVVKPGREFQILAQNDFKETIAASPAISNRTIYFRTFQALYAVRLKQ